jgi:hypothetical protein
MSNRQMCMGERAKSGGSRVESQKDVVGKAYSSRHP